MENQSNMGGSNSPMIQNQHLNTSADKTETTNIDLVTFPSYSNTLISNTTLQTTNHNFNNV